MSKANIFHCDDFHKIPEFFCDHLAILRWNNLFSRACMALHGLRCFIGVLIGSLCYFA